MQQSNIRNKLCAEKKKGAENDEDPVIQRAVWCFCSAWSDLIDILTLTESVTAPMLSILVELWPWQGQQPMELWAARLHTTQSFFTAKSIYLSKATTKQISCEDLFSVQ